MKILLAIAMLALTRAEIIERMKAPPLTMVQGLVSVYGNCDSARRREYQQPIAGFAADICRKLYAGNGLKESRFTSPRIVITIGDEQAAVTNVISTIRERDGEKQLRISLPSPEHSDVEALRAAVARGFFLAVKDVELSDEEAMREYRKTDPVLRAEDSMRALDAWRKEGESSGEEADEDFLKTMRTVHVPGMIFKSEAAVFGSRLYLYPDNYRFPFAGKYTELSFLEAIRVRHQDMRVRLAALKKVTEVVAFGGGHGEEMDDLVEGYSKFLRELATGEDNDAELYAEIQALYEKLKGMCK